MYYVQPLINYIMLGDLEIKFSPYRASINDASILYSIYAILFSFIIVFFGYIIGKRIGLFNVNDKKLVTNDSFLFYTLTFIAFSSMIVFSSQYGGVLNLIKIGALIRNSEIEVKTFGFIRYFCNLCFILLPFILVYIKNTELSSRKLIYTIILLVNIFVFFIIVMANAGRENIIAPFFLLLLYAMSFSNRSGLKNLMYFIGFGLGFVFVIVFGHSFFSSIASDREVEFTSSGLIPTYLKFFSSFSYPFYSLTHALDHTFEGYNFFEFLYAPVQLIPQAILKLPIYDSISSLNSLHTIGVYERTVPPGAIAYFLYNGGVLGLIIGNIVFGVLLGIIDRQFSSISHNNIAINFTYVVICYQAVKLYVVGDPTVSMYHMIPSLVFIFFVFFNLFFMKNKMVDLYEKNRVRDSKL